MKVRMAVISILAVLSASSFAAFPGGVRAEGKTITFAVGGAPAEFDFWERIVRDFTAETGIDVELLRQPTDTGLRRQSLVIALSSRKSDPDVFLMDVAWLAQFAASRWLTPLDPSFAAGGCGDRKAFFPRILKLVDTYEGRLVALPVYVDGGVLYYRTDLLNRYGFVDPPRTLEAGIMRFSLSDPMSPGMPSAVRGGWDKKTPGELTSDGGSTREAFGGAGRGVPGDRGTDAEIEDAVCFANSQAGWSTYINGMQADYDPFKERGEAGLRPRPQEDEGA